MEPLQSQIPDYLRVAVDEAAGALKDWTRGGTEPEMSVDRRSVPIHTVFDLVSVFSDAAPKELYEFTIDLAREFRSGMDAAGHTCADPKDGTYGSIAACLRALFVAREDRFRRRS